MEDVEPVSGPLTSKISFKIIHRITSVFLTSEILQQEEYIFTWEYITHHFHPLYKEDYILFRSVL